MSIVSAIVLFAVIWFLVLLVALPFVSRTQAEAGEIEPGTHAGAPADFRFGRLALRVSLISFVVWAVIAGIIVSGWITIEDLDVFGRLRPGAIEPGGTGE